MQAIHIRNPFTIMPFGQYEGTYVYIINMINPEYIQDLVKKGFITIDSNVYIKMVNGVDIDEMERLIKKARSVNVLYEKEIKKND